MTVVLDSSEDSDGSDLSIIEVVEQVFSSSFPQISNKRKAPESSQDSDDRRSIKRRRVQVNKDPERQTDQVLSLSQPPRVGANGKRKVHSRGQHSTPTLPIARISPDESLAGEQPLSRRGQPLQQQEQRQQQQPQQQRMANVTELVTTSELDSTLHANTRTSPGFTTIARDIGIGKTTTVVTATIGDAALPTARKETQARIAAIETQAPDRQSYLQIFDRILHTVMRAEAHLFSDGEREILSAFSDLDRHSRYLYTRIFMRKPTWIRVSSLNYGEPAVVEQSCKYLSACSQTAEPFLQTESDLTEHTEAMSILAVNELRAVAKAKGLKQIAGRTKEALCNMITNSAKQRTVTSFFRKGTDSSSKQRLGNLVKDVINITGPLIRLNPTIAELFQRLHYVFFRTPVHLGDDSSMKLAVLATIGQIRFPTYEIKRSANLFASREDVVQCKALAEVGYEMGILAASPVKNVEDHRKGWEMFVAYRSQWIEHLAVLLKTQKGGASGSDKVEGVERKAVDYWRRHFTPGWALARIVERGAKFAATLKQYSDERDILETLLSQTAYRLGRRGEWYERLILLYTTHLLPKRANGGGQSAEKRMQSLVYAREICIRSLHDVHVNRVSLHAISRQLRNIEAKLELDETQQVEHPRLCVEWKPVHERIVYGVRIRDTSRRGPSLWDGPDGVPCSVEQLALWRYRDLGYMGIHTENAIITTLFSLLFWDIIFYPLPGVLDTEYQSQPLDMGSESFFHSRRAQIQERLDAIAGGEFERAIQRTYDAEKGAECVGVSWDLTCEQLLIIARHIGGVRLAAICRVLASEYRLKRSGFPDLCMWSTELNNIMFVEVKGPKDKLSETQRDWLDILTTNNIDVEVCHVREGDARDFEEHG
ncbi:hypothetical protein H4R20_001575 [Coemansia guatemalensis]|uniref:Fanconi-associated nuclease n=1 Tax=Coemansia guatemalensis TaxID=2761395 RepID=A0A9W8LVV7_9FUNG|nr:hypothetical protein H4R20_001575 [Coemansia guatemalensis]